MDLLEIVGQAHRLRDESNRQLAAAAAGGVRSLARRLRQLLAGIVRRAPSAPQLR